MWGGGTRKADNSAVITSLTLIFDPVKDTKLLTDVHLDIVADTDIPVPEADVLISQRDIEKFDILWCIPNGMSQSGEHDEKCRELQTTRLKEASGNSPTNKNHTCV